jgi:hypothetical protein
MVKEGSKFPKKINTPLSSTCKPEVDVSPELSLKIVKLLPISGWCIAMDF